MYHIAVEKGLDNLANYLTEKGYKINSLYESSKMTPEHFQMYDAIVTNDIKINVLEIHDEVTHASVINSNLLGIQDGLSTLSAINTGILNENFTSVPIINVYNLTPEEVNNKLHSLK